MNNQQRLDHMTHLLEKLLNQDLLIIVEGKKDKRTLESLGFKKIQTLNKPLFSLVESIEDKEVALLVDLDIEGRKLYSKLKTELTRNGIKVNDELRTFLFRTPLQHIEGLATYLETIAKEKDKNDPGVNNS